MTTRTIAYHTLICDGPCKQQFGHDTYYPSVVEARAEAYAKGWRFPPKRLTSGNDSPTSVSDVCPDCVGEFRQQAAHNPWAKTKGGA